MKTVGGSAGLLSHLPAASTGPGPTEAHLRRAEVSESLLGVWCDLCWAHGCTDRAPTVQGTEVGPGNTFVLLLFRRTPQIWDSAVP